MCLIITIIISLLIVDGAIITNSGYKTIITPTSFRRNIVEDKEYSFKKNGTTFYYVNVVRLDNKICFKENGKIYTKTDYTTRGFKFNNKLEFDIYYYTLDDTNLTRSLSPHIDGYWQFHDYFNNGFLDHPVWMVIENITHSDVFVKRFFALS